MNLLKFIFALMMFILYRGIIDIIYLTYLPYKWGYMGFYIDIDYTKAFISYLSVILIAILFTLVKKGISSLILLSLILFYYIPIGCLYSYMNLDNSLLIISTISFLILIIFNVNFSILTESRSTFSLKKSNQFLFRINSIVLFFSWSMVVSSFVILFITNLSNISLTNVVNLQNVYEVRNNLIYPLGTNYTYSWSTKVVLPVLIYVYTVNNEKFKLAFCILLQLGFYLVTGHKLILFGLLIVFIVIKFKNYIFNRNSLNNFLLLVNASLLVSLLEIAIYSKSYIVDYIYRRTIYVPALLTNYYHQYTEIYGFRYWRDSFFGRIFGFNEDTLPSYLIGELYFGDSSTNAVTGFLGSEYLNLGLLGILLASIIVIVIIKLINYFALKVGDEIVFISLIIPLFTLWNSALLTALLTGGIFIALLIMNNISLKVDK
ncbi:MAG: hypothetical protein ACQEWE_16290 [Bacillota bacterium]